MGTATLTKILETVGAPTLAPWCVPLDRARTPLADVVIYDRHGPDQIEAGSIVLGVGLDGGCEGEDHQRAEQRGEDRSEDAGCV